MQSARKMRAQSTPGHAERLGVPPHVGKDPRNIREVPSGTAVDHRANLLGRGGQPTSQVAETLEPEVAAAGGSAEAASQGRLHAAQQDERCRLLGDLLLKRQAVEVLGGRRLERVRRDRRLLAPTTTAPATTTTAGSTTAVGLRRGGAVRLRVPCATAVEARHTWPGRARVKPLPAVRQSLSLVRLLNAPIPRQLRLDRVQSDGRLLRDRMVAQRCVS